ncbi:MAG: DUF4236 domain-containing protein [Alphaproteobacteria bacterium]|nr:DUF4236 domain-containing protein [Alphaproteobacteria bacterium]
MGLRFRQSFQLFPGVRINLSARGLSASFGVPGATLNVSPKGIRSTIGLPGSGLSYSHFLSSSGQNSDSEVRRPSRAPNSDPTPDYGYPPALQMRQIGSASVEELTSHSLAELRDMIVQARRQRTEILSDLKEAQTVHKQEAQELERKRRSLLRFFFKKRISALEKGVPEVAAEIDRLSAWLESTRIDMQFNTGHAAKRAFGSLVRAFETLRGSARVWDVTSDRHGNRVIERSYASRTITRTSVSLDFASSDLVRFNGHAMRFCNGNGEDILIYPGIVLMPRVDGAFALIDLRELALDFQAVQFVEGDVVPADAQIVHHTWAKVNKDGSPDRRFRENYKMPVCLYGRLLFTSPGGIEEEYQFSNVHAAGDFARALESYKAALSATAP